MVYSHLLTAVLSFAIGVLVTDTAHDYRAAAPVKIEAPALHPTTQARVCEHLAKWGHISRTRGCA